MHSLRKQTKFASLIFVAKAAMKTSIPSGPCSLRLTTGVSF